MAPEETGLDWLEALGPQRIRPGLSRTRALLAGLGDPQGSFRSVLVAGTNGKGSTAAFASSILAAAGVRAGLYTSPHLVEVTERVRVGERDVPRRELSDALALVAAVSGAGALAPTYFEALTVAAFELFRRRGVTVAVVEVGIGGRLDATNVLSPEVSAVTNVGLDHLDVLGPTLADVAREKAGVFRPGRPALTAATGEALAVLAEEAARVGARLLTVPPAPADLLAGSALRGEHQRTNLALAIAAASAMAPLGDGAIRDGIASVRWPGRLQRLARPGRRPLLLDGAHNPDGARALAAHLDAEGLSGRVDLLFGALGDKDVTGTFAPLGARARCIALAPPPSPRAVRGDALARLLGRPVSEACPDVASALDRLDRDGEGLVLVAGSLYLVGEVLRLARA
ncbi:MAG: bifunctional folylpolyglutamate synthase/dihydrofolate synthase [Acidobacteria bacterium]|nr:MAG: bifunctional folylpolyglutamate synthase/dihydrofolate synthase [Acidobacteriota bacterium]